MSALTDMQIDPALSRTAERYGMAPANCVSITEINGQDVAWCELPDDPRKLDWLRAWDRVLEEPQLVIGQFLAGDDLVYLNVRDLAADVPTIVRVPFSQAREPARVERLRELVQTDDYLRVLAALENSPATL